MRKMMRLWIVAISALVLSASSLFAQDISGDWQGTLKGSASGGDLRLVLRISKNETGDWSAMFYSIDQGTAGLDGAAVSSLTLNGADLKFSIESLRVTYEGKLSSDGNSIKGTWTGRRVSPLDFERATKPLSSFDDATRARTYRAVFGTGGHLEFFSYLPMILL